MGSTLGTAFRLLTWGESHGAGIGVVIDGCPPRLPLTEVDVQRDLDRRRPGQSSLTTPRNESDLVELLSGVFEGRTTGAPISILVRNEDAHSASYEHLKDLYRPSHADFTYDAKYGHRDWRGGGRSSARETIGRVAAGAVARRLLDEVAGIEVLAWVSQIRDIGASADTSLVSLDDVERHPTRCPDPEAAAAMAAAIDNARQAGDSLGGIVTCVVRGAPAGLGAPVFDRLEADLAKGMLSLPAAKGFDVGSGFDAV
ncbi:MAG: chorismate synthase, partial [Actinomycetota bacterium]|nr:chorismate synthase [Actinomycetota bacterium]